MVNANVLVGVAAANVHDGEILGHFHQISSVCEHEHLLLIFSAVFKYIRTLFISS